MLASATSLRHEDHIDHLPDDQQQKLQAITAVFTKPDVAIPIDMLILFGSAGARRLVDDQETGYKSDYDFAGCRRERKAGERP